MFFELRVICVEDLSFIHAMYPDAVFTDNLVLSVSLGLYHGGINLGASECSTRQVTRANPLWCEWVKFGISIGEIPRATRLCMTLYGTQPGAKDPMSLGWVNVPLVDFEGKLKAGVLNLPLW